MSKTSTQAKRQWNARNYTEFRAIISKDIGMQFREVCKTLGVSYNSVFSKVIKDFLTEHEALLEETTENTEKEEIENRKG